jgi:mRNA interferase RelE/StbE
VKVQFRERFARDLEAITDETVRRRVGEAIERVEQVRMFQDVPNLRRLEAKGKYYRVRVGEYRLGLTFDNGVWTFVRCLNRKDIYRYFP